MISGFLPPFSLLYFFCLILSFALAALAKRFRKVFIILVINSLLHLFLDALQTKFANGVQFFVPFSWKMTNLELFWPESLPTYLLTAFGLIYFFLTGKKVYHLRQNLPCGLSGLACFSFSFRFILLCLSFF
jgi:hypothetical protein